MTTYRVLDADARTIGGVRVSPLRTVDLNDAQARYPLDQGQVVKAHPLDRDFDGSPGGSLPRPKRARRSRPKAPEPAPAAPEPAESYGPAPEPETED